MGPTDRLHTMTFLFSGLRVDTDVLCAAADQLKSLCEFQGDDTFYCLTPQRWLEILTFAQSVSRGSATTAPDLFSVAGQHPAVAPQ